MPVPAKTEFDDSDLLAIAREIVMEIHDPETIFRLYKITPKDWERIQKNRAFLRYVETFQAEWNSSLNIEQRVKLKAQGMWEGWLEEANRRAWAQGEPLAAKVELMKMVARVAGQGFNPVATEGAAPSVSIKIDIGAGKPMTFENVITPKVIDLKPENSGS